MKKLTLLLALLVALGISCATPRDAEKEFYRIERAKMQKYTAILVKEGRYPELPCKDHPAEAYEYVGQFNWHGTGRGGFFGAYSFYMPAFEQARRSWILHAHVNEGSNELRADDYNIVFTKEIVGYNVGSMGMTWTLNGKDQYERFEGAKVVKLLDPHSVLLDKTAPHHAEQYGMGILPQDWTDLCTCANNSGPIILGPDYVDGHPVTKD